MGRQSSVMTHLQRFLGVITAVSSTTLALAQVVPTVDHDWDLSLSSPSAPEPICIQGPFLAVRSADGVSAAAHLVCRNISRPEETPKLLPFIDAIWLFSKGRPTHQISTSGWSCGWAVRGQQLSVCMSYSHGPCYCILYDTESGRALEEYTRYDSPIEPPSWLPDEQFWQPSEPNPCRSEPPQLQSLPKGP